VQRDESHSRFAGNWTAAIALMDQASTTRPPLTLTYELLVRRRSRKHLSSQLPRASMAVKYTVLGAVANAV